MANVFSMAGTKFFIGGQMEVTQGNLVANDFAGETWVEVDGIGTIGSFGDQANFGEYIVLGTKRPVPFLVSVGGATSTVNIAYDELDPGQDDLLAAGNNPSASYAVKIQFDNATSGAAGYVMFTARFSPPAFDGGGNNDALTWSPQMAITSNVVLVKRTLA